MRRKVYEGTLVPGTHYTVPSFDPPDWVGTFSHCEPGLGDINTQVSFPVSRLFEQAPPRPRKVVIYIED